jgi:hypothetical protein
MGIKGKFAEIYHKNLWGSEESKSGPGSSVSKNLLLLDNLTKFVLDYNIKKISDCGCGDFNWFKLFNFNLIDSYVGYDIVCDLVDDNNKKYSNDKIKFECSSIADSLIENSDLIICKDVLFHLSYDNIHRSINNIKQSKPKYFMSTNFTDFENFDIKTGGWRPINLISKPFNLGKPMIYWENIESRNDKYSNKSIGIWRLYE